MLTLGTISKMVLVGMRVGEIAVVLVVVVMIVIEVVGVLVIKIIFPTFKSVVVGW